MTSGYNPDQKDYWRLSVDLRKTFHFANFKRLAVAMTYLNGAHLDRFSQWDFGPFGQSRLYGFPGGSVRAESAGLLNLSYGLNIENVVRFEVGYDQALVTNAQQGYSDHVLLGRRRRHILQRPLGLDAHPDRSRLPRRRPRRAGIHDQRAVPEGVLAPPSVSRSHGNLIVRLRTRGASPGDSARGGGGMNKRLLGVLRLATLGALAAASTLANVIYVDANATGADDGSSWVDAFPDLQAALTTASAGDEIWVTAGVYRPTATFDRAISFELKNGVGIYGGFAGTETQRDQRDPASNVTTLSGDIGVAGGNDNSVYVVTVDGSVTDSGVLDGFTITAAQADQVAGFGGSGMWIEDGAPTLSRLIFIANNHGGLRVSGGSPTLTDCQFLSNHGGGASASGDLTCRNCVFRSNGGPGVSVFGSLTLVNAIIAENTGTGANVLVGRVTLDNCTLAHNGGYGLFITNRTLTTVRNTIIWGNTLGGIHERRVPEPLEAAPLAGDSSSISYCDVQDEVRPGPGNISADPLFLAPPGDLRPGVGSPVVDAGSNASVPPGVATDIDGLPRFMDDPSTPDTGVGTPPIVDMGAHERQPHLSVTAPGNLDLCAGEDAVLSVSAFGLPPFAYQWRRDAVPLTNGGRILGTDTATLTISDTGSPARTMHPRPAPPSSTTCRALPNSPTGSSSSTPKRSRADARLRLGSIVRTPPSPVSRWPSFC